MGQGRDARSRLQPVSQPWPASYYYQWPSQRLSAQVCRFNPEKAVLNHCYDIHWCVAACMPKGWSRYGICVDRFPVVGQM